MNAVIQRGTNESEIIPLCKFARERGVTLRFIEFMDVGSTNGWSHEQVVPYAEIIEVMEKEFSLEEIAPNYLGETAKRFRYTDSSDQEVGFISSVSKPFCQDCNRVRLSADGQIFTCLFASSGHDIKTALRDGSSDEEVSALVKKVWSNRDDRYSELHRDGGQSHDKPEMSYIGG